MSDNSVSKLLKKLWKNSDQSLGLRDFARKLMGEKSDHSDLAKRWWANKKGACNQATKPENIARAKLEAQATKAARQKKSGGKTKTSKVETVDASKVK